MSSRRASDVVKDMQCPPGEGEPMVYLGRVSSDTSDSSVSARLTGRSLESSDDRTYDINIEVPVPRRLPKEGDQVPDNDVMYPTPARNLGDAKFQVPDVFGTHGVFVEDTEDPISEDKNYNDPELKFANDNPKLSASERKATKSQKGLKIKTPPPNNRSKPNNKRKQSKNRRSSKKKSTNKKSPRGKARKSKSRSSVSNMDSTLSDDNSSEGEDEVFESEEGTPKSKTSLKLNTRKRTTGKKSSTRPLKSTSHGRLIPVLKKRLDKAVKKGHVTVKRGRVRRKRRGRGPQLPHNLRKLLVFPLAKIDKLIRARVKVIGHPPIRLAKKFVAEMAILLQIVVRRMIVQACAPLPARTRISRAHVKEAAAKDPELEMLDEQVNNQHWTIMRK